MPVITAEQCVVFLRDALANRPADTYSVEALDWYADVAGTVNAYLPGKALPLLTLLPRISDITSGVLSPISVHTRTAACAEFAMHARAIYTQLRLMTNTFTAVPFEAGEVYNYFEEVRGLMASATRDLLFIDPYIDPYFINRYLPQVPGGVTVRLLTAERQAAALRDPLALFERQHQVATQLRVVPNASIHDRYVVVDGTDIYQSGASFKDGARNAPTLINQLVDVAAELIRANEVTWAGAPLA